MHQRVSRFRYTSLQFRAIRLAQDNGPVPSTNDEMQNTVTVPDVDIDLSEDNIAELSRRVCPADPSTVHGLNHFVSAKQFVC